MKINNISNKNIQLLDGTVLKKLVVKDLEVKDQDLLKQIETLAKRGFIRIL